ncbi:hypothetical protein VOLCADRAFT_86525 [Volvox carteri f. nagariensis]|uniref:C2 domain-containing protein n=1 Tax=Volvox carteri f. nagariensis TaxID=3068 RepID=D8TIW9_VOLCA|nr:uncharacterized protein VOLCADRAFT_86525 [Volvox carteri f. nagariensis]EFJ52270.1 hypothetical protein VOLCADRAFT_86525 [Volvox carteri f. nagariensis]|eukprot:XP_002946343.1 hypothetical protein VOLCADRAFT_86525 [Volvox carteri f. nagariensis]
MVFPFIGASIATGIGTLAGLSLGPYLYSTFIKPTSYRILREEVDHDHKIPAPDPGLLVRTTYRDALPLLEPWVTDPDYERVSMINRLLATVWPTLTKAIMDLVVQGDMYNAVLYPQLKAQVFDKYAFVEDIFLGPNSLRHGKVDTKKNPFLADKVFTVGQVAPRLGGMRVVPTADDEVLLETSLIWGSEAKFDVHVILRFGRLRLIVPLQLSNISFKVCELGVGWADVRVLIRPLVEKFPCLGGVSVSLLRVPVVDFSLQLIKGVDIMALPFIPQIVHAALKVVLEPVTLPLLNKPLVPGLGVVLPNALSFPIMPKFGLPDPPVGAVKVTVKKLENIKGGDDMYCKLEVRKGRYQQTRTVDNNKSPEYNEEFALIVDSLENDVLRLSVYEVDVGWSDTLLGEVVVPFGEVVGTKTDPATGKEVTDFKASRGMEGQAGSASSAGAKSMSAATAGASPASTPSPPSKPSILTRIFSRKKSKKAATAEAAAAAAAGAVSSGGASDTEGGEGARTRGTAGALSSSRSGGNGGGIGGPVGLPEEGAKKDKDIIGHIHFKIEFVRFNKPEYDDVNAEKEEKSKTRDPYLSMFPGPPGRTLALLDGAGGAGSSSKLSHVTCPVPADNNPYYRGVLTVQLIRCIDLAPEGAKDLATYVRMIVTNDKKDEKQDSLGPTSSVIVNETSPRWGDKFDFVLIPSTSELHIHVHNKPGVLGNLVGSLLRKKGEETDPIMGKVLINVEHVARNGRIKETWALEDAERGYIELNLSWQTCHLSRDQQLH